MLPPPVLIEPPEGLIVTLAECKAALGIAVDDDDEVLSWALEAATDALDAGAGGSLGRALREQTWELRLSDFVQGFIGCDAARRRGCREDAIALPFPPLLEVVSVKYYDLTGVDRTLVLGTGYRVQGIGQLDGRQWIEPPYGACWPAARCDTASVRIRFKAGYDDDVYKIPKQLKQAIVLGVRALLPVAMRDATVIEERVEGVGSTKYQADQRSIAIVQSAAAELVSRLRAF